MARVTVEDCIDKVDNRFELVLLAAHRVKQISKGSHITLQRENDKNSVLALREIAKGAISTSDIKEDLIYSMQKQVEVEDDIEIKQLADATSVNINSITEDDTKEITFENLSEEDLLAGMEKLASLEKSDDR